MGTGICVTPGSIASITDPRERLLAFARERCAPFGGRVELIARSFTEPLPACDAYLMMTVLHDWSDAEAVRILAAVKRAAPAGAKLVLLESVIGLSEGFDFGKDLDIEMLVMTTGRERTAEEWTKVLAEGGWRVTRIVPTRGMSAIVEAELS